MMTKTEVMTWLKEHKDDRGIEHWKRIAAKDSINLTSYGMGLSQLRKFAKQIGRDHKLAQQLWDSNVYDAKIIGLLVDDPKQLTREQVEQQVENLSGGYLAHVFAACGATLPKAPFALDIACEWMDSKDAIRRRCAWGLIYEISKAKGKKAPDDGFFMDTIQRIQNSIHAEPDMWVRESMNGAIMGIGKRTRDLNRAAIQAVKTIGPVDVDYGDDNSCEPLDVLKHLTSDSLKQKFGT
jgi:hypothetical protein